MRTRISIMLMLLLGLFLTVGGTGLAVNGLSGRDNAAKAQYGNPGDDDDDRGDDDSGDDDSGDDDDTPSLSAPASDGQVAGEDDSNLPADQQEVLDEQDENVGTQGSDPTQTTRQLETANERQLPFTGYAAIPIMLLGILLLTLGLVTRHRARAEGRLE